MSDTTPQRTLLLTGASRGIGHATVKKFAAEGWRVISCSRQAFSPDCPWPGGERNHIQVDLADPQQTMEAVRIVKERLDGGRLDALVNNAGVIEPVARLEESDPAQWAKVVDINLMGVYNGMHAAFDALKASRGTVVNVSSGAALNALEGWSHYCATKAAVLSLTRSGHKEWGPLGITVVGMSPGTVATDMQVVITKSGMNPISTLEWSDHIPAEWAGRAIAFLCTDAGAAYAGTDFSLKTEEGRRAVGLLD